MAGPLYLDDARLESMKSLSPQGAVEIAIARLLIKLGFHHKRIAALFDCNHGRIAEIAKGKYGWPSWWLQIPSIGELSELGQSPAD